MTEEHEPPGPVIRDKRRIDPATGQVREPRTAAAPSHRAAPQTARTAAADGTGADPSVVEIDLAAALAERTTDLQRLQAEYLNYKRRVDRDRETARQSTIGAVLAALLPVLDDIGRAREHGELSGGFKAVAESLERTLTSLGLQSFGEPGEPFDPRIHEALMHSYSDDVTEPVCQLVLQVGYRHGDRILRPARVAVAEPPADAEVAAADAINAAGEADAVSAAEGPSDLSDGGEPIDRLEPDKSEDEPGGGTESAAEPTAAG